MTDYYVVISEEAEKDLKDIAMYVAQYDSPEKALKLLDNLEETCSRLEEYTERGHVPKELERLSVVQFLEIFYKPYRIIYEIDQHDVYVHCVIDIRRDIESVLRQRLLRI